MEDGGRGGKGNALDGQKEGGGEKGRSQSGREEGEAMVLTPLARQDAAVGHRSGDMRVWMWVSVSNG